MLNLEDRLKELGVPGVSIAIIDGHKIADSQYYGFRKANFKVTEQTRFQAASISKPVATLVALLLVEKGWLDLDASANAKLSSWKVPSGPFGSGAEVTLRHLLSHASGLDVHGFPGYRADTPLLPTLVQILDGVAPANTHPVRIVEQPGLKCRYSGGGFTVLQLLIEDVTGNSFANLTKELVFSPLDMTNSTYQIMRPTDETANFSSGHDKFGKEITGQWHLYPESAAAGLWSTAIDLAKFVMEIQSSVNGQSRLGLSAKYAQLMTQPQVENNALGFKVDESKRFFHTGSNEGFRALLAAKGPGKGVVAMTNGENGEEIRKMVFEEIQSQIGF